MTLIDKLSQAQSSTTYALITILFFPINVFITLIGLVGGFIERKFVNKRLETPPGNLAVIITGCSTGFGFNLAVSLANQGVTVYAGVRKQEDGQKVKDGSKQPENIIPIIADVTKADQLKESYEVVKNHLQENGLKLLGLVNNAGYGYYSPIEAANIENYKRMFDVNVFGLVQATQAFLPLLRNSGSKSPLKPRVINISSGAGHVVIPPSGTYCSTKFAVEAISDAMRIEFAPWNIHVALVEPGRFKTEFQDKAYVDFTFGGIGEVTPEIENHYKKLVDWTNEESVKKNRADNRNCVKVIEDSLFDTLPLARYLTGVDVQLGVPVVKFLKSEVITDTILGKKWATLNK